MYTNTLSKAPLDKIPDPLLHVDPVTKPSWHVPLVREKEDFIGLAICHQRVDEPCRVPEMHVLVNHPMDEEQLPSQVLRVVHN